MKKITFFITSVGYGGGERYVRDLAEEFGKSNEITVVSLTTSQKFQLECEGVGVKFFTLSNFTLYDLSKKEYLLSLIMSIKGFIKNINSFKNSDIVHSNGFPDIFFALALKVINKRTKLIYTHHTLMSEKGYIGKLIWGLFYKKIDKFIVVSSVVQSKVKKNFPRLNIEVIYNWVNKSFYNNYRKYSLDNGKVKVVSVGRLVKIKKTIEIVTWAKLNSEYIDLLLIGDGPLRLQVEELIETNKDANITHIPYIENSLLPNKIREYSAAIYAGESEGFCIAAAEALALGMPVITTENALAIKEVSAEGAVIVNLKEKLTNEFFNKLKIAEMKCESISKVYQENRIFKFYKMVYEL